MSAKFTLRVAFLLVLLIIVGLYGPGAPLVDAARLAILANRIAEADRIVVTTPQAPVSISITGDDVRKFVAAVSSASSARPPTGMARAVHEIL